MLLNELIVSFIGSRCQTSVSADVVYLAKSFVDRLDQLLCSRR